MISANVDCRVEFVLVRLPRCRCIFPGKIETPDNAAHGIHVCQMAIVTEGALDIRGIEGVRRRLGDNRLVDAESDGGKIILMHRIWLALSNDREATGGKSIHGWLQLIGY